jgi:hypothetical protein
MNTSGVPEALLQFCNSASGAPETLLQFCNGASGTPESLLQFCNGASGVPETLPQFCNKASGAPEVLSQFCITFSGTVYVFGLYIVNPFFLIKVINKKMESMKKIKTVDFYDFQNNEHGQFHSVIRDEIIAETPEKLGVIKFFPSYVDDITAELISIDVEQGSQHTTGIGKADQFRDQLYRSFVLHSRSGLIDYDPAVQAAAERIVRIIDQVGDMRRYPYNKESETLTSFTNQLQNNYAADVALCKGTEKLARLADANNSFIANFGTRTAEVSSRPSGDVRITRAATDETYKNIISIINALTLINGDAEYSTFIDKVNYQIDYYKNTINRRRSSGKDDEEEKDNKDNPVTPS